MSQLRKLLFEDHAEVNALLERLAEDAASPSATPLQASWAMLEPRLLRHMDAEEELLLPLVEASHPGEVRRIRAEHADIRKRVADLGVAVELHTANKADILELVALLTRHAASEDKGLYRLAGERASVAVQHSVLGMLKGRLKSALGGAAGALKLVSHPPR